MPFYLSIVTKVVSGVNPLLLCSENFHFPRNMIFRVGRFRSRTTHCARVNEKENLSFSQCFVSSRAKRHTSFPARCRDDGGKKQQKKKIWRGEMLGGERWLGARFKKPQGHSGNVRGKRRWKEWKSGSRSRRKKVPEGKPDKARWQSMFPLLNRLALASSSSFPASF